MSATPPLRPSFSPSRKWRLGFEITLLALLVVSVVCMINFLGGDYFARFYWSGRARHDLAPATRSLLRSVTNQIKITLYYDKEEPLYPTVLALANQYHDANPNITVEVVDYSRDPVTAQRLKKDFDLVSVNDKELILFDLGGRHWTMDGKALAHYAYDQTPEESQDGKIHIAKNFVAFEGEKMFNSAIIALTGKPLNAYVLRGHYEHPIDSNDEARGYSHFKSVIEQSYVSVFPLSLSGSNAIPADCHLLIIPGPRSEIPGSELRKIDQYLDEGGRMLVLLNSDDVSKELGIETVLAKWGVQVGKVVVVEDSSHSEFGTDVIVDGYAPPHPLVDPILGAQLKMIQPRPISSRQTKEKQAADAPTAQEIIFSSKGATLTAPGFSRVVQAPLAVAVEKGALKDVVTERGNTRILVIGDSYLFANRYLDQLANRHFAGIAANWLLYRAQNYKDIGYQPVPQNLVIMTRTQKHRVRLVLLVGLPGTVFLLGGIVWFRRRS